MPARFKLSEYARIRMQQSDMPLAALEDVLRLGRITQQKEDKAIIIFDRSCLRAIDDLAIRRVMIRMVGTYAVVGGHGDVVDSVGRLA